jgi:cysteine-rich repeat protein
MRNRIQRAVMMGLLISIGVGTGACLSPLGEPCGDSWCPDEFYCTPVAHACVRRECGNAIAQSEAGEECDDGNLDDEDSCLSNCQLNKCGDGKVNPRTEACDDGNLDDGDDCLSTCQLSRCGDGKVDRRAEACDDGNLDDGDDCLSTCELNRCGDGKVNPRTEACDDGNTNNDDGCHNDCTVNLPAYVKASNTGTEDRFGYSVALSADGSTLAIGAWAEESAATGIGGNQADNSAWYAGAVYVFTRSGTTWSQQAYVKASNADARDRFGSSVALSADGATLAVGADWEASAATGIDGNQANNTDSDAGAVYVFTRSGTTWSQQAYVKASNTDGLDHFGNSVALSADGATLAVGAHSEDSAAISIGGDQTDNSASFSGAVYVFTRSGTTWSQQAYVKASNTDAGDYFGWSIALYWFGVNMTTAVEGYRG